MNLRTLMLFVLAFVLITGCDREDSQPQTPPAPASNPEPLPTGTMTAEGWTVVDATTLSAEQTARLERARAAQKALGGQLVGALKAKVESEGYVAAIDVCQKIAPQLATQVAQEHQVDIGRTSFRLRNPTNAPKPWIQPILAARSEAPHVLTGPGGAVATAVPLFVDGLCLKCHGTDTWRAEGVDAALAQHYPDDEATGFEPGQLRGYFWVEVR